eukprot:1185662-Prorocentrum_minimum.AAC.4
MPHCTLQPGLVQWRSTAAQYGTVRLAVIVRRRSGALLSVSACGPFGGGKVAQYSGAVRHSTVAQYGTVPSSRQDAQGPRHPTTDCESGCTIQEAGAGYASLRRLPTKVMFKSPRSFCSRAEYIAGSGAQDLSVAGEQRRPCTVGLYRCTVGLPVYCGTTG